MCAANVLDMISETKAVCVALRFANTQGVDQQVTIPISSVDPELFAQGKMFDGSSIGGWQPIHESDMVLMPDPTTAQLDPFCEEKTLVVRCDVIDPNTSKGYVRDPRSVAKRAELYLQETGIADSCYVGPEPEFFLFDDVRWDVEMKGSFYSVDSQDAAWNSGRSFDGGNIGHRAGVKGGYFNVPPVDSSQDIRTAMSMILEDLGCVVEAHHSEVSTSNQNEISTRFDSLLKKADEVQLIKHVVRNVAHVYGKTATFMPKPVVGDNGTGMHVHQSLAKDGKNLFMGDKYAGLSEMALHYIGGIIKHARTLNAFTNPTTNSYKRLVPGYEAPVLLAYSARNRSAAIRIPHVSNPNGSRIEVRFPDPTANPYLAFSAMLMAGLDGIKNKINPGEPMDHDLYELSEAQLSEIPTVCHSLEQAIFHLENDNQFLLEGGVFSEDLLRGFIGLKKAEINRLRMNTHPVEFDMYYSL